MFLLYILRPNLFLHFLLKAHRQTKTIVVKPRPLPLEVCDRPRTHNQFNSRNRHFLRKRGHYKRDRGNACSQPPPGARLLFGALAGRPADFSVRVRLPRSPKTQVHRRSTITCSCSRIMRGTPCSLVLPIGQASRVSSADRKRPRAAGVLCRAFRVPT
jgi:hypothetical protein